MSKALFCVIILLIIKMAQLGFPGGSVVENSPANAGDTGSMLDPGRSHMLWSNLVCVAQL